MNQLRKRLESLEAAIAPPDGRPFCIWGTINDCTSACDVRPRTKLRSRSMLQ
jgi:hypothetical protein